MRKRRIVAQGILFEVKDIFGKKIRTSASYWEKIATEKHSDLKYGVKEVQDVLRTPDIVHRSIRDATIALYRKKMNSETLVVVAKHLNDNGFVATVYQTTKPYQKGEILWQK